jgi:hypothetical protein
VAPHLLCSTYLEPCRMQSMVWNSRLMMMWTVQYLGYISRTRHSTDMAYTLVPCLRQATESERDFVEKWGVDSNHHSHNVWFSWFGNKYLPKKIRCIQGRIYAWAQGARAQSGILKKIEIEVWYAGKKGCPQERNLREIYNETLCFVFCQFFCVFALSLMCWCCTTRTWIPLGAGAPTSFLGPGA